VGDERLNVGAAPVLTIRQARPNDVPALRSLIQEMADYERLPLLRPNKPGAGRI